MQKVMINAPLNRVEGDLEIRTEVDGGRVSDAWCSGTMYRGFEKILAGRGPLDGLVITPRICGICTTSHLTAAVKALDMIAGVFPPPNAVRIRNLTLMAEHIQSDMRHAFLMFAADLVNPAYRDVPLFDEAVRRYQPFKGETVIETIKETKKVLEIIAIVGGEWPHSSYMVPGGIVSNPASGDLMECLLLLKQYRSWYEKRILGCSLERWLDVRSSSDIDVWLEENNLHRESDLGFYIRFAREIGLDRIGRGHGNFISYGSLDIPEGTKVKGKGKHLVASGFAQGIKVTDFSHEKILEHVSHSWFMDYNGGRHPFNGETIPYASGRESGKYSWAKSPRYDALPAETGPLAEMITAENPLFTDLVSRTGPSAFTRELARISRPAYLMPAMEAWILESVSDGKFYTSPEEIIEGKGYGVTQASRGALGHWVQIENGAITHYQIITPTAWNASPRDSNGTRGPLEEALIGTEIKDPSNPVELGHVVRSFDCCLVCTVHTVNRGKEIGRVKVGAAIL